MAVPREGIFAVGIVIAELVDISVGFVRVTFPVAVNEYAGKAGCLYRVFAECPDRVERC